MDSKTDFSWETHFKNLKYINKGKKNFFFISLDTEYVQDTRYKNICLSYQVSVLRAVDSIYKEKFINIERDERLTLKELVDFSLELYPGTSTKNQLEIILIAHNSVAEFSMLKDKEKYISNLLTIRKTLTTKKPISLGNYTISLYDTILIAPVGYQSLKKLAEILGDINMLKVDIKQSEIENMDKFKKSNLALFTEYAMQDSRVTLAIWLLLQNQYNELVYDVHNEDNKHNFSLIKQYASDSIDILNKAEGQKLLQITKAINERNTSVYRVDKFYKTIGEASVRAFYNYIHTVETKDIFGDDREYMEGLVDDLSNKNKSLTKYLKANNVDQYLMKGNPVFQRFVGKFPWYMQNNKDKIFNKVFINDIYFGGRNESFYVGNTKVDPKIKNDYLFIDLDFTGAYPTAMSTIPLISWEEGIVEVTDNSLIEKWCERTKKPTKDNETCIVGFVDIEFVFPVEISSPCLPVKHDKYGLIYPLEGKTLVTATEIILAMQILKEVQTEVCQSRDYKDLEKQYEQADTKDKNQIKKKMQHRRGYIKSFRSIELLAYTSKGKEDLLLKRYLQDKIKKRNACKKQQKDITLDIDIINKAKLNDKLYKEFVNTLYGKTAQAVNAKNTFDIGINKSVPLKYSSMTTPYVASTTTGIVRGALSALIYGIELHNKKYINQKPIVLISGTTDGALFGIPINIIKNYGGVDTVKNKSFEEIFPTLAVILENIYPTRLLKEARMSIAKDSYVEIKSFSTEIYSVKTRGQIGFIYDEQGEQKTTVLAKFGHKPPLSEIYEKETYKKIMSDGDKRKNADSKWLIEKLENLPSKIETYPVRSLIGIKKILDPNDPTEDLVGRNSEKKMNFDYDYKRHLTSKTPYTTAFKSLREMLKYRYAMENLRKRGLNASAELIEAKVQMNSSFSRMRGSLYDHALKMFLRTLFKHEEYKTCVNRYIAKEYVEKINSFIDLHNIAVKRITIDSVKNAKRAKFETNSIPRISSVIVFVKELHKLFEIKYTKERSILLFTEDKKTMLNHGHHSSEIQALEVFLTGVFLAISFSDRYIRIFSELNLISRDSLEKDIVSKIENTSLMFDTNTIQKSLSIAKQATRMRYNKIPNTSVARNVIKELRLSILSLIPREKEKDKYIGKVKYKFSTNDFYKILLEEIYESKAHKNPAKDRCLKYFCIGLLHNISPLDTIKYKFDISIIEKLKYFGLTKNNFYKYKKEKFIYKALKNTPENRKQIKQMYTEVCRKPKNSKYQLIEFDDTVEIQSIYEIFL